MMKNNPFKGVKNKLIAITGSIASGKTTAAREFGKLGAAVIDCDLIAKQACAKGEPALRKILNNFGSEVITKKGYLERKKLGKIVFSDPRKRKILESIVHPYVIKEMAKQAKRRNSSGLVIIDAPLLFEARLERFMDKVIVVWVAEKKQITRIVKRDNNDNASAKLVILSQMPLRKKMGKADHLINNSGTLQETRGKVKKLWEVLTKEVK